MEPKADIAVIGLAVMGQNLILNMNDHGFTVVAFNRTVSKLVFHGWFDKHDRRFIEEMAQNTAREIFVKKFLQPNPFLRSTSTDLPPVKLESYLRAKVVFPDQEQSKDRKDTKWKEGWKGQRNRHAVLSSGGKDSLLTFGLLRECGHEVHPIFVNESGRHWFTALNAYRYFAANIKNTARVWTNSDRLFSWMLKHLPFFESKEGKRKRVPQGF